MAEEKIGNYRLFDEVGRGGMGVLYKAEQTNLGRFVALKVLHPYLVGDPVVMKRFNHEARAAALLNHPNIVQVYDVGADEDQHYIAMEFVPGRTLAQVLENKGRLPPEEALRVADQVAAALSAAHDVGIIHRDVKPSNILIDEHGKVKVTDFGIAVAAGRGDLTDAGHLVGTARYMSPEHARGEELDGRTDLYALGIVMYEMFMGIVPFDEESPLATLERHVNDPVPPMQGVPPGVEALVMKCLEKRRVDRPRTAREFRRLLREAAAEIDWQGAALLPLEPTEGAFEPDPSFRFDRAGVLRSATDTMTFALAEGLHGAPGARGRLGRRIAGWLATRIRQHRDSCKAKRVEVMELRRNLALAEQQLEQAKHDCDRAHEKYESSDAELHEWQMSGSLVVDRKKHQLSRESAAVHEKKLWTELTSYKLQWQNLQDQVRDWYGNVDRARRNYEASSAELALLCRRRRRVAAESGVAMRNRLRLVLTLAILLGGGGLLALQRTLFSPPVPETSASVEGRFLITGLMNVARDEHAAAVVDDDHVLVAGGIDAARAALDSAEIFNRLTRDFTRTDSLKEARFNHTMTSLGDGRVVVIGGETDYARPDALASVELFFRERFAKVSTLHVPRTRHRALRLADGRVLVTGGADERSQTLDSAELFDPATNRLSLVGPMRAARRDHTSDLLRDGRVVVIGGDQGKDRPIGSVERYDPVSERFEEICALLTPRYEHASVVLDARRILVFGGRVGPRAEDALSSIELVDLELRTSAVVGQLRMPRKVLTATPLSGVDPPTALIVGGAVGGRGNICELFAFGWRETKVAGMLNSERNNHTVTSLADGSLLITGGYGRSVGEPLALAELYVRTPARPAK